jgi:alkanesulfonate monooxygenase SsuD/methylene tetrahydromethanopterin reductase-like flavin-dependent oxidoreductase (luciferase family)
VADAPGEFGPAARAGAITSGAVTLQLGAHVGQQNMTMAEMRAVWRRLDEAGLDWISAWDHLYEAPPAGGTQPHFEAIATLGALCVETKRARIGTLVFCVLYRNPGLLAKAAVTLDHLSDGRFELGLGAGWHDEEARAFGYDFPDLGTRFDMLEEALPLVRDLLDPAIERVTHEGRFYRTHEASCLPAPVGGRRMPLWVGGTGPKRTPKLAAAYADGWNAAYINPRKLRRLNDTLDAECTTLGRDPATLERSVNLLFMLSVDAAAEARLQAQLEQQWGDRAAHVSQGALMGTPDQAIEKILAYHQAGAQGVNIALRAPWDGEALDAYLEVVVPGVRREIAPAG